MENWFLAPVLFSFSFFSFENTTIVMQFRDDIELSVRFLKVLRSIGFNYMNLHEHLQSSYGPWIICFSYMRENKREYFLKCK